MSDTEQEISVIKVIDENLPRNVGINAFVNDKVFAFAYYHLTGMYKDKQYNIKSDDDNNNKENKTTT